MVVEPERALQLAPVAPYIDRGAVVVAAGRPGIQMIGIDRLLAGETRAPVIIVELAGEIIGVVGAVARRPIMRIVVMDRGLVPSEAIILGPVIRQAIIDARNNRLAIAELDQRRRQRAARFE